jgi:uncharacterized protein (DUF2384 family)
VIAVAAALPQIAPSVALTAIERIGDRWGLRKQDLPALLGRKPRTVRAWFERPPAALDLDVLERISHVLAIYNDLHLLFEDAEFADSWVQRPNAAFDGARPVEALLSGSFTTLVNVRNYLDAIVRA